MAKKQILVTPQRVREAWEEIDGGDPSLVDRAGRAVAGVNLVAMDQRAREDLLLSLSGARAYLLRIIKSCGG